MRKMEKTTKKYRHPFLLICIIYCVLLTGLFVFNIINPFSNEYIEGDCINGRGTYLFSSGIKYTGQWKDGKRHGEGTLTSPHAYTYEGEWKSDRMHGYGVQTYSSGSTSLLGGAPLKISSDG